MKIKKADLKALQKEGVTVRRKMGEQPPTKEVAPPKKKVKKAKPKQHASMSASMNDSQAQLAAANQILARNGEMIREFTESVKELKPREPSPYTFDIKRDGDGLLKRVYARPGIVEEDDDVQRH